MARRIRRNGFSTPIRDLAAYLKAGPDAHDFAYKLVEYLEYEGQDDEAREADDDPLGYLYGHPNVVPGFKRWMADKNIYGRILAEMGAEAPTSLYQEYRGMVPADTWMLHFSNYADKIAKQGFLKGHADMTTLGLTTNLGSRRGAEPGYSFAFLAGSDDARRESVRQLYGSDAVLFQASGVRVFHDGDNEEQVIFWGPSVKRFIYVERDANDDSRWLVTDRRTEDELFRGRFEETVDWAIDHSGDRGMKIANTIKRHA